jgi:hypothetical protein
MISPQKRATCWLRTDRRWVTTLVYEQNGLGEVVAERKTQIEFGNKGMVPATEVDVDTSNERWSDITLTDGTQLKFKSSVIKAIRVDGEFDSSTGNPIYILHMAPTMIPVDIPDKLKKKS